MSNESESSSWLSTVLFGGICVITALLCLLHAYQEKLLYFPTVPNLPKKPQQNPQGYRSPGDYGINYEDMYIITSDGVKIHGWLMKQSVTVNHPTIIYFHGNAGNIGFRLPNAVEMMKHLHCNILLVDYRGYGNSEGVPTELGLQKDAQAVLNALLARSDINPYSIFPFGRSLGGAVALYLAEAYPDKVAGIILENTFLNIASMVDALMPLLSPLKSLVLRMDWPNAKRIVNLRNPILFLAGDKDELVPPSHMRELYKLARQSSRKEWYSVQNGTHNDTWLRGGEMYYTAIRNFMEKVAGKIVGDAKNNLNSKGAKVFGSIPSMLDEPVISGLASRASRDL